MTTEDLVVEELSASIQTWINNAENRSYSELGRRSRINEQTIRRIVTNKVIPRPDKLLPILMGMTSTKKIKVLKNHFSPVILDYMTSKLPGLNFSEEISTRDEEGSLAYLALRKPFYFRVYLYILVMTEVSRSEVYNEFGKRSSEVIEYLISKEKIKEVEEENLVASVENISFGGDKEITVKAVESLLKDHFQPNEVMNQMSFLTGKISAQAMEQIVTEGKEFALRVVKIIDENRGDYPMFFSMQSDLLSFLKKPKLLSELKQESKKSIEQKKSKKAKNKKIKETQNEN